MERRQHHSVSCEETLSSSVVCLFDRIESSTSSGSSSRQNNKVVPGIPVGLDNQKARKGKDNVRYALQLAQHSTQSQGRYVFSSQID